MSQNEELHLLVEIVERELPAASGRRRSPAAATMLAHRERAFPQSPASFPPSIVLEKGLSKGCLSRFRSIRGAGHVLAECARKDLSTGRATTTSSGAFTPRPSTTSTICSCGESGRSRTWSASSTSARLLRHRNPRIDFLHRRFRKPWQAEAEAIRETHGDFVLFTSRFSAVNHFRRSLDETLDRRKEQYTEAAEATIDERYEIRKRLFADYRQTIGESPTAPRTEIRRPPAPERECRCFGGSAFRPPFPCRDLRRGCGEAVAQRRAMRRAQCLHHRHRGLSARPAGDRISSGPHSARRVRSGFSGPGYRPWTASTRSRRVDRRACAGGDAAGGERCERQRS